MQLRIGILIIGSLYWDSQAHRKKWREERLDASKGCSVRTPIRYGRRSSSRCETYTMVFSQNCCKKGRWGQAVVVPCRNLVESAEALIGEARALWRAERADGDAPVDALGASWGCVALLKNPKRKIPNSWLSYWKETAAKDPQPPYGLERAAKEKPVVDTHGMLLIPWPRAVGEKNSVSSLDLLLATATNPTIEQGCYPSAQVVAEAWNRAAPKWCAYFWQNRKNGILTFEDEAIQQLLNVRSSTC